MRNSHYRIVRKVEHHKQVHPAYMACKALRRTSKIYISVQVVIKMTSSALGGLHPPPKAPSYLSLCPQWHTLGDPPLRSPRWPPAGKICCRWSAARGWRMSEMPRCGFDRLKSPFLQILPGWPSSLLSGLSLSLSLSLPCKGRIPTAASSLYSLQSTGVVSRHTSGGLIGVALAFYTSRHCVIFGNRGEKRAPGLFFFFRKLTPQLMSFATNQTPPEVREIWCFVLYISINHLLQMILLFNSEDTAHSKIITKAVLRPSLQNSWLDLKALKQKLWLWTGFKGSI